MMTTHTVIRSTTTPLRMGVAREGLDANGVSQKTQAAVDPRPRGPPWSSQPLFCDHTSTVRYSRPRRHFNTI